MKDYEEKSSQISKYNEAGLQIMRLNELWLKCEFYASRGFLIKWKFKLDSIWRELYADVLRSEKAKDIIEKNGKLKKTISGCKTSSTLYDALNERHQFLKENQDSFGKGGIYIDEDSDDFEWSFLHRQED